jgi:glycosyltransferase involved in cell wall biosynthesis
MTSNSPLTVVLPTLNGARFLQAQLDSITAQQRRPDLLIVSDDGSHDETCAIIRHFADYAPFQVVLRAGPRIGLSANMRSLLAICPAGHVALADQDDVWLPHKLAQACAQLKGTSKPSLYAARRIVTDAALRPRGLTKVPRTRPSFSHALHRNIAPGNTVVLNPAAQALARRAALAHAPLPAFHDWWLYQLITGAGGQMIFDPEPALLYRQHGQNLFGAAVGLRAHLWRLRQRFDGTYHSWVHSQCRTLHAQRSALMPEATQRLDHFISRHLKG